MIVSASSQRPKSNYLYISPSTPDEHITEPTNNQPEYNHLQDTTKYIHKVLLQSEQHEHKQTTTYNVPIQPAQTPTPYITKSHTPNSSIPKRETLHDVTSHTHFFASSIGPSSKTTVIPLFSEQMHSRSLYVLGSSKKTAAPSRQQCTEYTTEQEYYLIPSFLSTFLFSFLSFLESYFISTLYTHTTVYCDVLESRRPPGINQPGLIACPPRP